MNPFKLDASLVLTPADRRVDALSDFQSSPPPLPLTSPKKSINQSEDSNKANRRPSSLFQLAIMRNFGKTSGTETRPQQPYNGLGGQESNMGPTGLYSKSSGLNRSLSDPTNRSRPVPTKVTKRKLTKTATATSGVKLDQFLRR